VNFDISIVLNFVIPLVITAVFAIGIKNGQRLGKMLSTFGNSKIGKKAMDKLEKSLIKFLHEFIIGLRADNVKTEVEEKIDKGIRSAYDEAMKK
jgi:hypothetical protein